MDEESIESKYDRAFEQSAALNPIFPAAAKAEMAQMVEISARANEHINEILSTNQNVNVKGGFIAEEVQAETFNLDATLKNDNARAYTDRYEEWGQHEWKGNQLKKNDTPDLIVVRDGKVSTTAQSKYYDTPEETARQMSQVKDGKPKYEDVDQLVGPSDQVAPRDDVVSVKEHAQAKADALKAKNKDPSEISAYEQTAKKSSAVVKDGKSRSTELTKADANKLGSGNKGKLKQIENNYKTQSTLKHMGQAAVGAAAMSAVVSGTVNTVRYIQLAKEGQISAKEATIKIIGETVSSAADSAIKASANAGVQSLLVRYGSKETALQVIAKQGMNNLLKGNAVTVGVACAVDAIKDLVRLGMGDISSEEFFDRQGKGVLMTSAGAVGGAIGGSAGMACATALGASSGTVAMTAAGLVGGLAGGMIAGLAMTLAIENGIERPYRDLVKNTELLHEAAKELERTSQTVFKAQVLFTKYLEADYQMEKALQKQFNRIDEAGQRALDAINRI